MEQYLNDAFHVVSVLIARQQSALAYSVAQLAIQAAGRYYSFGQLTIYIKQMDQLFEEKGK